jgi:hypothetical protein
MVGMAGDVGVPRSLRGCGSAIRAVARSPESAWVPDTEPIKTTARPGRPQTKGSDVTNAPRSVTSTRDVHQ